MIFTLELPRGLHNQLFERLAMNRSDLDILSIAWDRKPIILAVEDSATLQLSLIDALGSNYEIRVFGSAEEARAALEYVVPDIMLLDIMLPGISGLEFLTELKNHKEYDEIPTIIMTSLEDFDSKRKAFDLGASDYITKPYHGEEVRIRVKAHLQMAAMRQFTANQNERLRNLVRIRTEETIQTRDATISALAALAETRDNETGQHIKRTMRYMEILLERMQTSPKLLQELNGMEAELIAKSAPLHDIGKVGIPDSILLKPGLLDAEERRIMEKHAIYGHDAILKAQKLSANSSFLHHARLIAWSHHEKWNGTGYPQRLSGRAIPIEGRLMALCDVYDALISKRVYKTAMSHTDAIEIIRKERGHHFDPNLTDLFLEHAAIFMETASSLTEGSG